MSETSGRFPAAKNLNVEELIATYDNLIGQVDEALLKSSISKQIPLPAMPGGIESVVSWGPGNDPLIPEDLTLLDSTNLGKLYSFITNWTNYLQGELSVAKATLMIVERHRKVIDSALQAYYKDTEGIPTARVDEKVATDARFVEIDAGVLRAKVFSLLSESRFEQYKRSLMLISREQTRRGDEFERETHEAAQGRSRQGTSWERQVAEQKRGGGGKR